MDSGKGVFLQKKRKMNLVVWDLDDTKRRTQSSTSQAASYLSMRFGPNSLLRSQQRSSSSLSLPRKLSPRNLEPHKSSPAAQTWGRVPLIPNDEKVRLRGNAAVSPSLASRAVDPRWEGKQASSPGLSEQAMEITRSGERMSRPFSQRIDHNQAGVDAPGLRSTFPKHNDSLPSSSLSSSDEERSSLTAVNSGDLRVQDVRRVLCTPNLEEALEPGEVWDSPILASNQEVGTPVPISLARSRWMDDPTSPTSSPEQGEFMNNSKKGSQDGEELKKEELQDHDEDSGGEDSEVQQPELESEPEENRIVSGPQHRAIDMLQGCRSVDEFERLNKINEGTYGVVSRARDKKTGEIVALKQVKMGKEKAGFPRTALREINVLFSCHHPSIVDLKEVVVGNSLDKIFMVMEYIEHDLKGVMESMKQPFSQSEVKCLMLQVLDGVKYLHDNWVLHRDLKTSNLLLNNRGDLKICDLGLARQFGYPLKEYTHEVVTLWYRAPELLLGARKYSTPIDMWSVGCIMAEFLTKEPLFPGQSPIDQIDKIFKTLGTPDEKSRLGFVKLPGVRCKFTKQPFNKLREKFPATAFTVGRPTLSEKGFDLLNRLLTCDPSKRITAKEALNHGWFREDPLPKGREFMPTFPAQSEEQRIRELKQTYLIGGGRGLFGY